MSTQTPNQVVAANLRRAREMRGLTQSQAAERIHYYLGQTWSNALFSTAERSVDGKRVRPFDADDLVAFSRAFDLPVVWFLMPDSGDVEVGNGEAEPLFAHELIDLVINVGRDRYGDSPFQDRLNALLGELEMPDRTPAQWKAEDFANATLNAMLLKAMKQADGLDQDLRSLAAGLVRSIGELADGLNQAAVEVQAMSSGTRGAGPGEDPS